MQWMLVGVGSLDVLTVVDGESVAGVLIQMTGWNCWSIAPNDTNSAYND
jgi:hypothetical protein